jgi:hypothetical protein
MQFTPNSPVSDSRKRRPEVSSPWSVVGSHQDRRRADSRFSVRPKTVKSNRGFCWAPSPSAPEAPICYTIERKHLS